MSVLDLDSLNRLPLWGQVLIAARMLKRALLAMSGTMPAAAVLHVQALVDAIEHCSAGGGPARPCLQAFEAVASAPKTCETSALIEAARLAVDAARAAEAAHDFPVDATVTQSCLASLRALSADARVLPVQIAVLLGGDIDLVRFVASEAGIDRFAPLGRGFPERLLPVHALSLCDPVPQPSDVR